VTNQNDDPTPDTEPRGSFKQTLKAVAWGFFGVRKRADQAKDAQNISPGHLIIIALLATAVFVAVLLIVANLFVANLS
jgi:hypothetical protein